VGAMPTKGAKRSVLQEGAWVDMRLVDGDPTQESLGKAKPFSTDGAPTLSPTPRPRKPSPSRAFVREARAAARLAGGAGLQAPGRRPRREDWCKRPGLAAMLQ